MLAVVSPTAFSYNKEAAEDNYFMDSPGVVQDIDVRTAVLREYAALYDKLTDRVTGVGAVVHLFTHEENHATPDGSCNGYHSLMMGGNSRANLLSVLNFVGINSSLPKQPLLNASRSGNR